ncbi:MAG: hypothetical protein K8M05_29345, partial [Deltaproteobacteria bacterium]|nr:hypothetical protein [Kofleriaceae bacterium]
PVPLVVLERPEGLEELDVEGAESLWGEVPVLAPTSPDHPPAPRVSRPFSGGEAMALADLALARGDAFDAAAQYRALLPALEPQAVPYAKLQLARAHAARGEHELADELLRRLVRGTGPEAWAALVELTRLRARDVGAREALRELEGVAGDRREELVDHLIAAASDEEAALLLIDKAARRRQCGYAFEAVRRWPDAPLEDAPAACRGAIADHRWKLERWERAKPYLAVQRQLNPIVARWDRLADAARGGDRDAEPWVVLAEDVIAIGPLARQAGRRALVERVARAALDNAAELALAHAPSDVQLLPRIRAVADQLDRERRDAVHRHIDVLVQTYGVR